MTQNEIQFPVLPQDANAATRQWYYDLCQVLRRYLPPESGSTVDLDAGEVAQNARINTLNNEVDQAQSDATNCDLKRIAEFNLLQAEITALQSQSSPSIAGKEDKSNKGIPNGYTPLDSSGRVPLSYLDLTAKEDKANKGVANGYAPLDSGALVPDAYLPRIVGEIRALAHTTIPTGWLECNGQSVLRAAYPDLFTILNSGAWYGVADGTHFYVPDLRGRVLSGIGTGPSNYLGSGNPTLQTRTIATPFGEDEHTLTVPEVPEQIVTGTLGYDECDAPSLPVANSFFDPYAGTGQFPVDNTNSDLRTDGGDGPHNNRVPELPITFVIRT